MNEQERKIKELRTLEAKKLDYLGLDGKFGVILKMLGEPIIKHNDGGGLFSQSFLEDYEELEEKDEIPTAYTDDVEQPFGVSWNENRENASIYSTSVIGWNFDGLSRGIHLEIVYKEDEKEIKVNWQGYPVYIEVMGELTRFVPNSDWQDTVDKLYSISNKKLKKLNKEKKAETVVQKKKYTEKLLERLKETWGF